MLNDRNRHLLQSAKLHLEAAKDDLDRSDVLPVELTSAQWEYLRFIKHAIREVVEALDKVVSLSQQ